MAISVENRNIFLSRVFCARLQGYLGIGYRRWKSKNYNDWLPGRERSLTISSPVWIQCTNVTDRPRMTAKSAFTH